MICALAIVGFDISDGTPYLADVDDRLRALQITQLLSSGRWFDLSLPMIRLPQIYVSAWSRLVDLPYVAISVMLSAFMDRAAAIRWSFLLWPPIMLMVYCVLVMRIIRSLAITRLATDGFVVVAMMLFMMLAVCEYTPGRIDHHNVQMLLLLAMVAGTVTWNRMGGAAIGISAGLSLAVGLEGLPIIAVLLCCVIAAWMLRADGAAQVLRTTMLAAALSTPIAALLFIGPAGLISTQCDTLSAPYVYLASLLALTVVGATFVCAVTDAPLKKLVVLLAPGLAIAAGFLWLFPSCTAGPYGIIDPVSQQFWFARVRQEGSALNYFRDGLLGPVALLAGQALMLFLALPTVLRRVRRGEPQQAIVFVTSLASLLLALALIRFMEFPALLVPLFLPAAFQGLVTSLESAAQRTRAFLWLATACLSIAATALLAYLLTPLSKAHFDMVDSMNSNDCAAGEIGTLAWPSSSIVMTPPTLALSVAEQAPVGLAVSAIAFHRASPGLRRTYLAFTTSDRVVRREAMAPFDYVAVCRTELPTVGVAPLYAALASGDSWPGLLPIGHDDPRRELRLFRIDHDRLQ